MPVHNTGVYLEECLNSVFNQTFQEFELVCIDDCSEDMRTREILKAFQEFCWEQELVLSGVTDKKNHAVGQRTEYNFLTVATEYVLCSSGIIIASNNAIYDELLVLLGNESRIVNLERYCP